MITTTFCVDLSEVSLVLAMVGLSQVSGTISATGSCAAGSGVPASRDNQGHVVALFLRTEAADAVVNGGDQISWRQVTMRVQRLDAPFPPEPALSLFTHL